MNNNNFFTITTKPAKHPLEHIKSLQVKYDQENPEGAEAVYLQKFISFVEADLQRGSVSYLLMPNSGASQTTTGLILINLGSSQKLAHDLVPELTDKLYYMSKIPQTSIENVYFNYTQIPGVWEWWEKGIIIEESFGTVNEDKLIGFARVGLA